MTVNIPPPVIESYLEWLQTQFTATLLPNGWLELYVPVLDQFHDFLAVYVRETDGVFEFSDDGEVLRNLKLSGWEVTDHRQDLLDDITDRFRVTIEDEVVKATADRQHLPAQFQLFIQALTSIGNLVVTSQQQVISIFKDDVQHWIQELDLPFSTPGTIRGRTERHRVDILTDAQNGTPPKAIRALDALTRRAIDSLVFARYDLALVHPGWQWIAFVNDLDSKPSRKRVQSLLGHRIGFIPYSLRDQGLYVSMLTRGGR